MRWIRVTLIVVAVVVLVIGAGAVFLLTLDLNNYKGTISALTERFTGRTLELNGRVDLDFGATTTLELTDASFGNPEWATEPHMARLARGKVVLDLRSVLDGPIIIERFELDDAELHLELLEDGRNNWTFGAAMQEAGDASDDGVFPLVLKRAEGQNLFFTLSVPTLPRRLEIRADQAKQEQAADGLLDATATGTLNERAISVTGRYGPLANLVAVTDVQFDINGKFDTLSIAGTARIDDLTWPRRPTIDVAVSGPAIDDVTEMFALPDVGSGDLDLAIAVHPDADGVDAMAKGNLGEYVIDTSARADELLALERFTVTANIAGPDLGYALRIFDVDGVPSGPFQLSGHVARESDRFEFDSLRLSLGAAVFNLNGSINDFRNLDDSNLHLKVNGNDVEQFRALLGIPGAASGPFQISANLQVQPGGAELLGVTVQTNIARLTIDGSIVGKSPDFIGTTLRFDGIGNSLADVAEVYDIPNVVADSYSVKGAIQLGEQKLSTTEAVVLSVGQGRLSVDGTIGYAPLASDTDVHVHATGQNLAKLVAMTGVTELVPSVPFDIRTGVVIGTDGYRVSDLQARLGRNDLKLDGVISRAANFTGTRLQFDASGPELSEVVADTKGLDFADGPFEVRGSAELLVDAVRLTEVEAKVAGAEGRLDAEISLPLETAFGRFDATANGPNLRAVLPARPRWDPPESPFEIRANGTVEDGLWSFEELTAQLANAKLTGSGVFDQPPDMSRTKLSIRAAIPKLSELGTIDNRKLPPTNVSFDLGFAGSLNSFRIDPFKALIGDGDLQGHLAIELDREVPEIDVKLVSQFLDLDALIAADPEVADAVDEDVDDAIEETSEPPEPAGDGRVIPNAPLPLEQLRQVNARIDVDAKTFLFRSRRNSDLMLDVDVRNGRLIVERLKLVTPDGDLDSSLSLVPKNGSAEFKTALNGSGIYVGLGGPQSQEDIENAPKYQADIELAGTGLTVRELAASLDGKVQIQAKGGRVPNSRLRFVFGGFFEEVLNAVNPFVKEDPYTQVSCLVVLLKMNDGLVAVDPGLVVQTDKMNIVARGDMNLVDEKVKIDFRTQPRSRVSISAGEFINPYLQVTGTMAEPQLTLDPTGVLVTGGAAVATAGLSLLATAVWDRVFRADDPCAAAVEQARKAEEGERKKFLGIF